MTFLTIGSKQEYYWTHGIPWHLHMIQMWDLLKTRESHFFCLVNGLYHLPMQAHNQKFFKAGEVSWHVDKHVVKKHTKKRPSKGRFSNFSLLLLKLHFQYQVTFFDFEPLPLPLCSLSSLACDVTMKPKFLHFTLAWKTLSPLNVCIVSHWVELYLLYKNTIAGSHLFIQTIH